MAKIYSDKEKILFNGLFLLGMLLAGGIGAREYFWVVSSEKYFLEVWKNNKIKFWRTALIIANLTTILILLSVLLF